ncbi:hypothetical protein ACLQ9T_16790 [Bordetella avium]|uniref:hypothetical protein n=1 Tax=Bordetella avium TaxID=521 RepID=UPI0039FCEEB4
MPGFVVLGVRPGRIDQLISTQVSAQERRTTPEAHALRIEKARARALAAPPQVELSAEYSAPQFAIDWARLAARQGYSFLQVAYKDTDLLTGRTVYQLTEQQP